MKLLRKYQRMIWTVIAVLVIISLILLPLLQVTSLSQ